MSETRKAPPLADMLVWLNDRRRTTIERMDELRDHWQENGSVNSEYPSATLDALRARRDEINKSIDWVEAQMEAAS